jgi:small subunit ribosomal protein S8
MNQKSFLNLQNILKNSKKTKPSIVRINFSKKSLDISSVLLKEGFIRGYFIDDQKPIKNICILLKYTDDINLLNLKSIKLKEQRKYLSVKKLRNYFTAFNVLILSTKKGVMSHTNALNFNTGGFPILNIT